MDKEILCAIFRPLCIKSIINAQTQFIIINNIYCHSSPLYCLFILYLYSIFLYSLLKFLCNHQRLLLECFNDYQSFKINFMVVYLEFSYSYSFILTFWYVEAQIHHFNFINLISFSFIMIKIKLPLIFNVYLRYLHLHYK